MDERSPKDEDAHFLSYAVLVAIAIPIFSAQLEKSKESTDAANLRSAYAEVSADYLLDSNAKHYKTVVLNCGNGYADWENTDAKTNVGKLFVTTPSFAAGATVYVYMNSSGKADLSGTAPNSYTALP